MSVPYYGDFAEDDTVNIPFNTFTSDDPSASCTITNFINTDVHIHKDAGLTQRNNAAGITVSVDFDGITGNHMVVIDTSDDTVAGFWVTGSEYQVRIEGTTVDGATINAWIGSFSIERAGGALALLKNATYGLSAIETLVDDLETRLTAARAGYLDELAAANIPADIDTLKGYCDKIDDGTDGLTAIKAEVEGLGGAAMRGTDSAALASVCTEARLSELDAATGGKMANQVDVIEADTTALNDTKIPDTLSLANINAQVDTALGDYDSPTKAEMDNAHALLATVAKQDVIDGIVDAILVDTAEIGAAGAGLTAVPWNANWDAEVQSECADALAVYDPPTRAELTTDKNSIITEIDANDWQFMIHLQGLN